MRKGKLEERECLHCLATGKSISSNLWFMVAVERPYANLWFHRECYKSYTEDELIQFLSNNYKIWYN